MPRLVSNHMLFVAGNAAHLDVATGMPGRYSKRHRRTSIFQWVGCSQCPDASALQCKVGALCPRSSSVAGHQVSTTLSHFSRRRRSVLSHRDCHTVIAQRSWWWTVNRQRYVCMQTVHTTQDLLNLRLTQLRDIDELEHGQVLLACLLVYG